MSFSVYYVICVICISKKLKYLKNEARESKTERIEILARSNPSPVARVFLFRNIQGKDLRMQIFAFPPAFQETVRSHLKPSLPVVVMVTLNQFNSNLFVVSVNNNPLAKISHYNSIHIL